MKTIASLDDLSLLNIFNRIPLSHLKTAGRVCTRWYEFHIKSASTRGILDLLLSASEFEPSGATPYTTQAIPFWQELVNDNGTDMYPKDARKLKCFDRLQLDELSMDFVQDLANFVPNVGNLTVSIDEAENVNNIDPLIYLLKAFNLTTLSIHAIYDRTKFDDGKNESQRRNAHVRLFMLIYTGLPSLKSLEFYYNGKLIDPLKIDLPISSKLEHFNYNSLDEAYSMIGSLERFDRTNPKQLKKIIIGSGIQDIPSILGLSPEFARKFAYLFTLFPSFNHGHFGSFCARFTNLTTLELLIAFPNISRKALFGPLERMTQLVCMKLCIANGSFLENLVPIGNAKQKISSLKVLVLKTIADMPSHKVFHHLKLHLLMPNLQVFHLDRDREACEECAATGFLNELLYEQVCLTEMINPIRSQFKKLRRCSTQNPDIRWDLTE